MNLRLTPQQKKKLSYQKDRRNTYGERGAHSRHAILDSKNIIERKRRHAENQTLRAIVTVKDDEEKIMAIENIAKSLPESKKKFHKVADTPLGEVIANKLAYREFKGMLTKPQAVQSRAILRCA
jgi:hypothetical protein